MNRKGQYFSFDAIVAAVIFILTIISLLSYWYSTRSSMEYQDNEIMREAIRASDLLFTAQPSGSGCQLGFAESWGSKVLNRSAIEKCASAPMDELKARFGLAYNITVNFEVQDAGAGLSLSTDDAMVGAIRNGQVNSEIAKIQRVAAIREGKANGELAYPAVVEVYLYR